MILTMETTFNMRGVVVKHEIIVLADQLLIRYQPCSPCPIRRKRQVAVLVARTQMIWYEYSKLRLR